MALDRIFDIAGSGLSAQLIRMNSTASNIANSNVVAGSEAEAFRGKRPVFQSILNQMVSAQGQSAGGGVRVADIVDDPRPLKEMYNPGHPMANADGYIWGSNVNEVEEMIEMLDASRGYQNNVEVIKTAKDLMLRTLDITKA
ncbi:MAG: Flagellar basal-body rod protein FlgC [Pseudomonadota bacterium]|jgi:flagellar basal-body rod protein FlgC